MPVLSGKAKGGLSSCDPRSSGQHGKWPARACRWGRRAPAPGRERAVSAPGSRDGPLGSALELAHVPESGERAGISWKQSSHWAGNPPVTQGGGPRVEGKGRPLVTEKPHEAVPVSGEGRTGGCVPSEGGEGFSLPPHWREVGTQHAGLVPTDRRLTDRRGQGTARSQRAGKEGRVCVSTWPPQERTAPPRAGPPVLSLGEWLWAAGGCGTSRGGAHYCPSHRKAVGLCCDLTHPGETDRHRLPFTALQRNPRNIPLTSETLLGFQSLSPNQRNVTLAQGTTANIFFLGCLVTSFACRSPRSQALSVGGSGGGGGKISSTTGPPY